MAGIGSPGGLSEEEIEDIVGEMADRGYGLAYDDPGGLIKRTRSGPNPYDAAQSFAESGLTITQTNTWVVSGSVILPTVNESTATRGADDSTVADVFDKRGVRFTPSADTDSIEVTLSANVGGGSQGDTYLEETDGTVIDSVGGNNPGSTYTLNGALTAGTTYQIRVGNNAGSVTHGYDSTPSFPYTSTNVDIDSGVDQNSSSTSSRAYNVASVTIPQNKPTSGNVILEWDSPVDIYEWDVATFTSTPDGETVDVFVARSDDGGSTWNRANGGAPISRNYSLADDSAISASDEIRIEAEISRANTSNSPALDSVYRSWSL